MATIREWTRGIKDGKWETNEDRAPMTGPSGQMERREMHFESKIDTSQ